MAPPWCGAVGPLLTNSGWASRILNSWRTDDGRRTELIAAGVLPAAIERFTVRYPRVKLDVSQTTTHLMGFAALHERTADVVLTLLPKPYEGDLTEHLHAEVLFYDRIWLAAGMQSPWARRRKINLADLIDTALISPASDTPGGGAVIKAFRAAGLSIPPITVTTFSVHLRNILSMRGQFIAVLPASILRFNPGLYPLKELSLDLPMQHLPVLIVTLRNHTLSPAVERFLACARTSPKQCNRHRRLSRWPRHAHDVGLWLMATTPRRPVRRRSARSYSVAVLTAKARN